MTCLNLTKIKSKISLIGLRTRESVAFVWISLLTARAIHLLMPSELRICAKYPTAVSRNLGHFRFLKKLVFFIILPNSLRFFCKIEHTYVNSTENSLFWCRFKKDIVLKLNGISGSTYSSKRRCLSWQI